MVTLRPENTLNRPAQRVVRAARPEWEQDELPYKDFLGMGGRIISAELFYLGNDFYRLQWSYDPVSTDIYSCNQFLISSSAQFSDTAEYPSVKSIFREMNARIKGQAEICAIKDGAPYVFEFTFHYNDWVWYDVLPEDRVIFIIFGGDDIGVYRYIYLSDAVDISSESELCPPHIS